MKKLALFLIVFVFIVTGAKAQSGKGISLSIGSEFSIPLNTTNYDYGSIRDYYKDGLGVNVKAEFPLTSTLFFTGSVGFIDYSSEASLIVPDLAPGPNEDIYYVSNNRTHYEFVPLKAGLQYYYTKYLYIDAEAGGAIATNNASVSSFIYDGGLGAVIPIDKNSGISLDVKYGRGIKIAEYDLPMSQISIGLAYQYKF